MRRARSLRFLYRRRRTSLKKLLALLLCVVLLSLFTPAVMAQEPGVPDNAISGQDENEGEIIILNEPRTGTLSTGLTWTLDDHGNLVISGNGEIPESAFSATEDIVTVTIETGVTSIGNGAFATCAKLASVTIPASVTSIDGYAFSECEALTTVYFIGTQTQMNALKSSACAQGKNDELGAALWIKATTRVPGDATGDGNVDGIDLIRMRKALAGENVEIDASSADATGDGEFNGFDLIRLRKYLAGEPVVLN